HPAPDLVHLARSDEKSARGAALGVEGPRERVSRAQVPADFQPAHGSHALDVRPGEGPLERARARRAGRAAAAAGIPGRHAAPGESRDQRPAAENAARTGYSAERRALDGVIVMLRSGSDEASVDRSFARFADSG